MFVFDGPYAHETASRKREGKELNSGQQLTGLPLRSTPHGEPTGPESPEALFISALLEQGQFDPERYGVRTEQLSCWLPLWHFCVDHQLRAGYAPPIALVKRKWRDFEVTPDVDPHWGAGELIKAAKSRELRITMQQANELLKDDDVASAFSMLENLSPPMAVGHPPLDGFDLSEDEDDLNANHLEVPYSPLLVNTMGIGEGELWYLGARTGMGKTNVLCNYVATAVAAGASVVSFSLEMPANQITRKIRRILAGRDRELLARLDAVDRDVRKSAIDVLRERIPGAFAVYDPKRSGRCTVETVRAAMDKADLLVIDHVGLMFGPSGTPAIDDWRVLAAISNGLKAEVLRSGGRILACTQTNRQSESADPKRLPKLSELADTDHLGRDADVVITMTRPCESVMYHGTQKVRNGPSNARWYSTYDPKHARFEQISENAAEDALDREGAYRPRAA